MSYVRVVAYLNCHVRGLCAGSEINLLRRHRGDYGRFFVPQSVYSTIVRKS